MSPASQKIDNSLNDRPNSMDPCRLNSNKTTNSRSFRGGSKRRRLGRALGSWRISTHIKQPPGLFALLTISYFAIFLAFFCDITIQHQTTQILNEQDTRQNQISSQDQNNNYNNQGGKSTRDQHQQEVETPQNPISSTPPVAIKFKPNHPAGDSIDPTQVLGQAFAQSHRRLLEQNWALERRLDRLEFEFRKAIHLWQASSASSRSPGLALGTSAGLDQASDQFAGVNQPQAEVNGPDGPRQKEAAGSGNSSPGAESEQHRQQLAADSQTNNNNNVKWAGLVARLELVEKFIASSVSKLYETEKRVKQLEQCECRQSCRWFAPDKDQPHHADGPASDISSSTSTIDTNQTTIPPYLTGFKVVIKSDGESWRQECDQCTCQRGQVKCRHLSCPVDTIKCKNPTYEAGKCCPVCYRSCMFKSQTISHGSKLVVSGTRDTCKECKCQDGRLSCQRVHINRQTGPLGEQLDSSQVSNEIERSQRSYAMKEYEEDDDDDDDNQSEGDDYNNKQMGQLDEGVSYGELDYGRDLHVQRRKRTSHVASQSSQLSGSTRICPPADCEPADQVRLHNDCCLYCRSSTDFCQLARAQHGLCHEHANCTPILNNTISTIQEGPSERPVQATDLGSLVECRCKAGFWGDGQFCRDIDECADAKLNSCDPKSTQCLNTLGSHSCACRVGFKRVGVSAAADHPSASHQHKSHLHRQHQHQHHHYFVHQHLANSKNNQQQQANMQVNEMMTHCSDIDECADPALNNCHVGGSVCVNLAGSYKCRCRDGYLGDGQTCHKWISSSVPDLAPAASYLHRHSTSQKWPLNRTSSRSRVHGELLDEINSGGKRDNSDGKLSSIDGVSQDDRKGDNEDEPYLDDAGKNAAKALQDSAWEPLRFDTSSFYQQDENQEQQSGVDEMTNQNNKMASESNDKSSQAGTDSGQQKQTKISSNQPNEFPLSTNDGLNTRTMFFQPPPWVWSKANPETTTPIPTTTTSTTIRSVDINDESITKGPALTTDAGSTFNSIQDSTLPQPRTEFPENNGDKTTQEFIKETTTLNETINESIDIHHHSSNTNQIETNNTIQLDDAVDRGQNASSSVPQNNPAQYQPYKKGTIIASATSSPTKGFLTSRITISNPSASLQRNINQHNHQTTSRDSNAASSQLTFQPVLPLSSHTFMIMIIFSNSLAIFFISYNNN